MIEKNYYLRRILWNYFILSTIDWQLFGISIASIAFVGPDFNWFTRRRKWNISIEWLQYGISIRCWKKIIVKNSFVINYFSCLLCFFDGVNPNSSTFSSPSKADKPQIETILSSIAVIVTSVGSAPVRLKTFRMAFNFFFVSDLKPFHV